MYAVIQSGGKQHRVVEGETLKVELLKAETGATITFDDVLMVVNGDNIQIGAPVVAGAKVTAEVVGHGRHDKIRIIKIRVCARIGRAGANRPNSSRRQIKIQTTITVARVFVAGTRFGFQSRHSAQLV